MSNEAPQSTSPPKLTLTSLPPELLRTIALLVDRSTALSLARVSRILTPAADIAIWRHIRLQLDPHYGKLPCVYPYDQRKEEEDDEITERRHNWKVGMEWDVDQRYYKALRAKVRQIKASGDGGRWRLVQKISMELRQEAAEELVDVLERTANVRKIETNTLGRRYYEEDEELMCSDEYGLLDQAILAGKLPFSHLTHLHLGRRSLLYAQTILVICDKTPTLTHLNIDLNYCFPLPWETDDIPDFPNFNRPTQIVDLRLTFRDKATKSFRWDSDRESQPEPVAISLLERVPLLKRLSVKYAKDAPSPSIVYGRVAEVITKYEYLEDLEWGGDVTLLIGDKDTFDVIPSLRRLAITAQNRVPDYNTWVPMSNIEFVHFTRSPSQYRLPETSPNHIPSDSYPSVAKAMREDFATLLRGSSRLESIHFDDRKTPFPDIFARMDEVERAGTPTVKILEDAVEVDEERLTADMLYAPPGFEPVLTAPPGHTYVILNTEGVLRIKTFGVEAMSTLNHQTNYHDRCVPLDVLEEMRRVDGISEKDWDQRGVQVSAESWRVLRGWVEAERASLPR